MITTSLGERIRDIVDAETGVDVFWGIAGDGGLDGDRVPVKGRLVVGVVLIAGEAGNALLTRFRELPLNERENLLILTGDMEQGPHSAILQGRELLDQAKKLGFEAPYGALQSPVTENVERLLNAFLLGERPVRHARIYCLVTMQYGELGRTVAQNLAGYRGLRRALIEEAQTKQSPLQLETDGDGAHYFHPHTHNVMVASPLEPGLDDEHLDERVVTISLPCAKEHVVISRDKWAGLVKARLESLRLHLYTERTVALEYALVFETPKDPSWGEALWRDIVLSGEDGWKISAACWLDYAEAARTLYSGFKASEKIEGKRGFRSWLGGARGETQLSLWDRAQVRESGGRFPVKGMLQHMLARFVGQEKASEVCFELRVDDRARIVQSLTLSGSWPREGRAGEGLPVLSSRFALVDEFNTSHFYNAAFAEDEVKAMVYDRFCGPDEYGGGSRFFANDHAFSHLGFGWFAAAEIGPGHIASVYRRMALLLQLNGAALFGMLRDLGDVMKGWGLSEQEDDGLAEELTGLHQRYLKFLNLNWFDQVSSQVQGIELFDLMKRSSPATRELALVGEQVSRTSDYLTAQREIRREALGRFVGTLIAIVTLLAGLPAMIKGDSVPVIGAALDQLFGAGFAGRWAFELAGAGMIALLAVLDWKGFLGTPTRGRGRRVDRAMVAALLLAMALPLAGGPLVQLYRGMAGAMPPGCGWIEPLALGGWCAAAGCLAGGWFFHIWKQAHRCGWPDRLTRRMGPIYASLIGAYVFLASLHSTGLVALP